MLVYQFVGKVLVQYLPDQNIRLDSIPENSKIEWSSPQVSFKTDVRIEIDIIKNKREHPPPLPPKKKDVRGGLNI